LPERSLGAPIYNRRQNPILIQRHEIEGDLSGYAIVCARKKAAADISLGISGLRIARLRISGLRISWWLGPIRSATWALPAVATIPVSPYVPVLSITIFNFVIIVTIIIVARERFGGSQVGPFTLITILVPLPIIVVAILHGSTIGSRAGPSRCSGKNGKQGQNQNLVHIRSPKVQSMPGAEAAEPEVSDCCTAKRLGSQALIAR
jgi:hypothetical protein